MIEFLDSVQKLLAGPAARAELRLELERGRVARIAEALEELVRELGRRGDERVEVAQVVLERALLARVEAPADREEQQDDDPDPDQEGKRAPLEDIAGGLPRRRGATAARGRRLAASRDGPRSSTSEASTPGAVLRTVPGT